MTPKPKNLKKLKEAAKLGDATAQFELAEYLWSKPDSKNSQIAAGLYRAAAEQGHLEAQYTLANLFHVYPRQYIGEEESIEWFKKAAAQGHVNSMYELGCCYSHGMYMEPVMEEAEKWFQMAADRGHARAQYELGLYHAKQEKHEKAAEWYKKAADRNDADAQFELSLCNLKGQGLTLNNDEGVKWMQKAGALGNVSAQFALGLIFSVKQDHRRALNWWLKAAKQQHIGAIEKVEHAYKNGLGTKKNLAEAQKWRDRLLFLQNPKTNLLDILKKWDV
ncbi:MAG: tetratricopeptide repeat protein [Verrucomicrobiota bacterium]